MPLNLSRGSIFSTYSPERSLISSIGFSNGYVLDDHADNNSYGSFDWSSSESLGWDWENACYNATGNTELENPCEPLNDVLARLPVDPFGMDKGSTFMAIAGCFQSFEKGFERGDQVGCSGVDEDGEKLGNDSLLAGMNWVWKNARRFQPEMFDGKFDEIPLPYDTFNGFEVDSELFYDDDVKFDEISLPYDKFNGFEVDGELFYDEIPLPYDKFNGFEVDGELFYDGYVLDGSHVENWVDNYGAKGVQEDCSKLDSHGEGVAPNEAMFFVLGYLGVQDLLSMEKVCTSMRDAVRNDSLPWRNILIDWPLNEKITDDALVKLTNRSKGTLQCLRLLQCMKITNGGLKHVLVNNPRLVELSVPGCVRVSIEVILLNLRAIKSAGTPGIKHLRIGGLSGVTDEQFKELKSLMGADNQVQLIANKPRFYHGRQSYLLYDDDRPIDVEVCPRCQKPRLVYDCPAEGCQGKRHATQLCRACTVCIARCFHCGRCIEDRDYEETFCLDMLCLDCWKHLLNCQERFAEKVIFHQETTTTTTKFAFLLM